MTFPNVAAASMLHERVTPAQVTAQLREHLRHGVKIIDDALVGRYVRVTSDHNGQPFGRSRKSWRGEVCRIKSVHIEAREGEISLCLEGHEYGECFISADEVEFT